MWRTYPFASNEVCCQKTSLNFVDSVWEIFGPLLKGVPLIIFAEHLTKDPLHFAESCEAHQITRIVLVPSFLRALLESESYVPFELSSLKYWTSSGQVLDSSLVKKFMQVLPGRVLLNLYGSSEVSADSTYSEASEITSSGQVPIGRPIDNTEVYLVDHASVAHQVFA
jgi:non-ribosomal peptide synthetase component F